jgi:hypothetical protein
VVIAKKGDTGSMDCPRIQAEPFQAGSEIRLLCPYGLPTGFVVTFYESLIEKSTITIYKFTLLSHLS